MIHTTRYAIANRTFVLGCIDMIGAPAVLNNGEWGIRVVLSTGHVETMMYNTGSFHTPQDVYEELKDKMADDYQQLVSALTWFHAEHNRF